MSTSKAPTVAPPGQPAEPLPEWPVLATPAYSLLVAFGYALGPLQILVSHAGSLLLLGTGLSLGALGWLVAWYLLRMLAITAIYHRLLTHRSYRSPRPLLWLGCLVGAAAGQMGPSWWKAHHLTHHRNADLIGDPHSPPVAGGGLGGFLWAQGGWLMSPAFFPARLPADVEGDPVLRAIDRFHFLPLLALCALSYLLGGLGWLGAFCLSTTLLFHGVATVNSVSHLAGQQPFRTSDHSFNNPLVALLTLGEGWHNTHHAFSHSCRHGFSLVAGQVQRRPDPTYSFIRLLARLGLASDLRVPSDQDLLAKSRLTPASGSLR